MRSVAIAVVLALAAGSPQSQTPAAAPPATEIYLADLRDALPLSGGAVTNVTNNPGYDNQPSFLPDGTSMLFSSNRDGKQTDIWRYDIETRALTQLTRTPESEYSPLVTPDGRTFSVVRVEADGTQRLWRFDLDGSNPRLVLTDVKPVGYHAWVDATHVALFVLGASESQPSTLQLADTASGSSAVIATNIGRSLQIRPGRRTLTFVSKAATPWTIQEFDPATRAIATITPVLERSEDFVWVSRAGTERLLMARETTLFAWQSGNPEWREAGQLTGLGAITRLAVRPSGQPALAVVALAK